MGTFLPRGEEKGKPFDMFLFTAEFCLTHPQNNSTGSGIVVCVHAQSCPILWGPMNCSLPKLLCPWNFPGKNSGVRHHFLHQGIFLTQGSNPTLLRLLRWQVDSLPLVPPGKPQKWYNWDKTDILREPMNICIFFKVPLKFLWDEKLSG